jgi:hypothetical protein
MKKREPKLQELKRYVKWLGGGSGPDFEELTDAGILRVTRMMNQDKKRGWWKDRNTKPDSRYGSGVMKWSWLMDPKKAERLDEDELLRMERELHRWTVELNEEAPKVGKPEATYKINPDGSYEETDGNV